jgi:hypothetical protein
MFKHLNETIQHIFNEETHSLTPSAGKLLLVIAGKCTEEGIWFSSIRTLTRLADIGDEKTTKKAVKEIEALDNPKVMSHTQREAGGVNFYQIHPLCPGSCVDKTHTLNPGANYPLPSGELQPSAKTKTPRGQVAKSTSHIETNKPPFKEMRETSSLCRNCEGIQYKAGIIHQDSCATYKRLIGSIPWEITKNQNSATWLEMTETDKQKANLDSLEAKAKRDSDKAQNQQEQDLRYERDFTQSLSAKPDSTELVHEWVTWLKEIHSKQPFQGLGHFAYLRALHYSRTGLTLPSEEELLQRPRTNPYPEIIAPGCEQAPDQLSA